MFTKGNSFQGCGIPPEMVEWLKHVQGHISGAVIIMVRYACPWCGGGPKSGR